MCHLSGAQKEAAKIQFAPEIVAVMDGLYCRVNFTVRLAVDSLLSGPQLQIIALFIDHQSYRTLYSNDDVSLI